MKTYRVKKVDKNSLTLNFEVYSYEERLEGEEPDIILKMENKYFYEGDWVYLDDKGILHHIDEIEFKPIIDNLSKVRNLMFSGDSNLYGEFLAAQAKWLHYLGNPKLITDEEKYAKDREGIV